MWGVRVQFFFGTFDNFGTFGLFICSFLLLGWGLKFFNGTFGTFVTFGYFCMHLCFSGRGLIFLWYFWYFWVFSYVPVSSLHSHFWYFWVICVWGVVVEFFFGTFGTFVHFCMQLCSSGWRMGIEFFWVLLGIFICTFVSSLHSLSEFFFFLYFW